MGQSLPNSVWFSLAFSYLNFTKGSVHFGGLLSCWAEGSHLPGHRASSIYLPFSSVEGRQQGVSVPHTSIPSFVSLSKWQLKLINPGNFLGRFFFPFMLGLSSNQSTHIHLTTVVVEAGKQRNKSVETHWCHCSQVPAIERRAAEGWQMLKHVRRKKEDGLCATPSNYNDQWPQWIAYSLFLFPNPVDHFQ